MQIHYLCGGTGLVGLYVIDNGLDSLFTAVTDRLVETRRATSLHEGVADTISLFILSKEEYEGKSWSQLVDSGQFLQVYHLSGDDIRRLGSCVPFPPTKEMCDMVMEPACQE